MGRRKEAGLPAGIRETTSGSFEAMYRGKDKKLYSQTFNPRQHQKNDTQRERERGRTRALGAATEWLNENRPQKGKPWRSPAEGKQTLEGLYAEWRNRPEYGDYAAATKALHEIVWNLIAPTLGDQPIGDIDPVSISRLLAGITSSSMR